MGRPNNPHSEVTKTKTSTTLYPQSYSREGYLSSIGGAIQGTPGSALLVTSIPLIKRLELWQSGPILLATWAVMALLKYWSSSNEDNERLTPRFKLEYFTPDTDTVEASIIYLLGTNPDNRLAYLARDKSKNIACQTIPSTDNDDIYRILSKPLDTLSQDDVNQLNLFFKHAGLSPKLMPDDILEPGERDDPFFFIKYLASDLSSAMVNGYILGSAFGPGVGGLVGVLNTWKNIVTGPWSVFPQHARYTASISTPEHYQSCQHKLSYALTPSGEGNLKPLIKQPVFKYFLDAESLFGALSLFAFRTLAAPVMGAVTGYGAYTALSIYSATPMATKLLAALTYLISAASFRIFTLSVAKKLLESAQQNDFNIEVDYSLDAFIETGKNIYCFLSNLFNSTENNDYDKAPEQAQEESVYYSWAKQLFTPIQFLLASTLSPTTDLPLQLYMWLNHQNNKLKHSEIPTSVSDGHQDILLEANDSDTSYGQQFKNIVSPTALSYWITAAKTLTDLMLYFPAIDSKIICMDIDSATNCYKEGRGEFVDFFFFFSENSPNSETTKNNLVITYFLLLIIAAVVIGLSNTAKRPAYKDAITRRLKELQGDKQEHETAGGNQIEQDNHQTDLSSTITFLREDGESSDERMTLDELKSSEGCSQRFFYLPTPIVDTQVKGPDCC